MSDLINQQDNNLPAFLQNETYDFSEMAKYSKPTRLKIIQAMSQAPFKPPFVDGDIVAIPQMIKIGGLEQPFTFTPIYFFSAFACLNPYQMKATLPYLREDSQGGRMVTYDESSEIAKKARALRKEPCPENNKFEIRYVQMLNFLCVVHDIPNIKDTPINFLFQVGEFKTGQVLLTLCQSRRTPPYANRFRAISAKHKSQNNEYFGLDFENDPSPFVSETQYHAYKKLHDELKSVVDSRQIDIDINDSDVPGMPETDKF